MDLLALIQNYYFFYRVTNTFFSPRYALKLFIIFFFKRLRGSGWCQGNILGF